MAVRPLRPDEAQAAAECSYETFADLDRRSGQQPPPPTPELRARALRRVAHLQRIDPDGAWAAEVDGRLIGVALALRRQSLWFLSLLVVEPGRQGAGTGRRLLEAALRTADGADAGWILSSEDPRALRRYVRAGFAPSPAYDAKGSVDRSRLPAVPAVRTGSYAADADLVEDVVRAQRGVGFGPDLELLAALETPLLVVDGPSGRGFAGVQPTGVSPLGATTVPAAQALLWAALAESGLAAQLDFLTATQQWAIEIAVAAGLELRPGSSSCSRGRLGPLHPYLPTGALG